MGESKAKETSRFQTRSIEIIFNQHIDGDEILTCYKENQYGLYKGFVKWHHGTPEDDHKGPHTHVAIILREKPKICYKKLKEFFKVGEVRPTLVNPMGKGNTSPLKKLNNYVSYLCDGHDNGHYTDSWNYKYDHEIEGLKNDGLILCLLERGKTLREIVEAGDYNFKAYVFKHKDLIDKMINNWRKFNRDDTVYHEMDEFLNEPGQDTARDEISAWDPTKETLILKGPSNMGKTELAKAILKKLTGKNPIFCSNLNKLKYRDVHQPFILDDMNFSLISRTKGIALVDVENERDIRILFGIHTIDAGCARIFTTNEEMKDFLPQDTHGAIKRRVRVVDLEQYGRLY